MSKGSRQRPGAIPDGAWEAIFAPKPVMCSCAACAGTGKQAYVEDETDFGDEWPCPECDGTGRVPCET